MYCYTLYQLLFNIEFGTLHGTLIIESVDLGARYGLLILRVLPASVLTYGRECMQGDRKITPPPQKRNVRTA